MNRKGEGVEQRAGGDGGDGCGLDLQNKEEEEEDARVEGGGEDSLRGRGGGP